jgi:spore coat protein A, manganese oxidase
MKGCDAMEEYTKKANENKLNPAEPSTIPKFIDPLPIPAVARPVLQWEYLKQEKQIYNIIMQEVKHRFHKHFPLTTVWGYNGTYPGPTIEVNKDVPVQVKWTNNLPDKHLLPVDHTLHGTMDTPDVRTVVHLHGANVEAHSDGYPEAWFTRNYATVGQSFEREVYEYTNHQPGATLWYHDHAIGITRLNVYAGLAGFYLIRDELEKRLNLPCGAYEIPIMIQDKTFTEYGQLFYPNNAAPPVSKPVPSTPSFFLGETIVVNGKLWPYLNVEPRKYRFRILNASNLRAYDIRLSNGGEFCQIGTEQGLLQHPALIESFILEPAERIDLVIDFSKFKGEEIMLLNGAVPPNTDLSSIMKFIVGTRVKCEDKSTVPEDLFPYHSVMHSLEERNVAYKERTLHLDESTDDFGRVLHLLNNKMWQDPPTEIAELDTIEVWHLVNHFQFPHPIHVHLVDFEIIGRQPFTDVDFDENGDFKYNPLNLTEAEKLTRSFRVPEKFESGLKDVVRTEPGQVTTIAMKFKEHVGNYVWHCHILEHEDNDMMRPLKVIESTFPIE